MSGHKGLMRVQERFQQEFVWHGQWATRISMRDVRQASERGSAVGGTRVLNGLLNTGRVDPDMGLLQHRILT